MRDVTGASDDFSVDYTRRSPAGLAPAVTAALTAVANLLLLPLWVLLLLASSRFDSSGQGGPFRSCTAESTLCSGPEYVWIAVLLVALAGGALLAAMAAARLVMRLTRARVSGRRMAMWSVPLTLIPAVALSAVGVVEALAGN